MRLGQMFTHPLLSNFFGMVFLNEIHPGALV